MSSIASILNDSGVPQLPDRREDFIGYEWKIRAYLDARGLLGYLDPTVNASSSSKEVKEVVITLRERARCYGILLNSNIST